MTRNLLKTLSLLAAIGIGVAWAGSQAQAGAPSGAPVPAESYTVPPGTAAGIGGQMYPSPVSVPPSVGITAIYPPLAPHEFLYHHGAHYKDVGAKTHVHYGGWAVGNKLHRFVWGPK